MTDLKPCPFCGGEARHYAPGPIEHHIECTNPKCYAVTHGWPTEAEAIAAWNARADYHGYEQAAIEAWESIKAWNARADTEYGWTVPATDENMAKYGWVRERTCRNIAEPDEMSDRPFTCSECGARGPYGDGIYHIGGCREIDGKLVFWDSWPAYKFCPNCGAKVVEEKGKGND